jgi:hypothetical protein
LERTISLHFASPKYLKISASLLKDPVDADNIIKPIQDAMEGLVYDKDDQITDVESHRRPLTGTFDITNFPPLLIQGITSGNECVYVKICDAKSLENYIL